MSLVVSVAYDDAIVVGADRMSVALDETIHGKTVMTQHMFNTRKIFTYSDNIVVGFVGDGGVICNWDFSTPRSFYRAGLPIPWCDFFDAFKHNYPDLDVYGVPTAFLEYCRQSCDLSNTLAEVLVAGYDKHNNRFRAKINLKTAEIRCLSGTVPLSIGVTFLAEAILPEIGNTRMEMMTITDAVDLVKYCLETTSKMSKFKASIGVGGNFDIYVLSKTYGCGWVHNNDVLLLPYPADEEPEPPKVARKVSQASKKVAKKPTTKKTR